VLSAVSVHSVRMTTSSFEQHDHLRQPHRRWAAGDLVPISETFKDGPDDAADSTESDVPYMVSQP